MKNIIFPKKIEIFAKAIFIVVAFLFTLNVAIEDVYAQASYGDWGGYDSYSSGSSGYGDYASYGDWGGYDSYSNYASYGDWGGYDSYSNYASYGDWGGYDSYGDYASYGDWGGYDSYSNYASYGDWGGYDSYGDYASYGDWGGYDSGNTYTDWYPSGAESYTDWYAPSGCTGSNCGGVAQRAADYYTGGGSSGYSGGSRGGCSGSGCGGGSRGGMNALGLNLNYSDDDVNIVDNSINAHCSNVGNASSSVNNVNCSTTTHIVADDNDDDDDLKIMCRVSDTRIEEGDTVTYEVEIDGGRSSYRIEWDGDISGDDEEERVRYNRNGTYEVSVEVRDANGDRATDDCPDVRVRDEDDDDDDDRRVTVTTGTNLGTPTGNLSSLDSVFLSQVPYTGASDIAKALGILALIAVWSTAIALYFKKQRSLKLVSAKISDFKEQNKNLNKIA